MYNWKATPLAIAISYNKCTRAMKPLEFMHLGIYDLNFIYAFRIDPTSFSNKIYFLIFINSFSMKTWIFFLEEKYEAFHNFQSLKFLVEKENYCHIKI